MNRASVGFVAIALTVMAAAAEVQTGTPERPRFSSEGNQPPGEDQAEAEGGRWGVFRGRVRFNGPPPEARIVADPETRIARRKIRGGLIAGAPPRRLRDFEVIARRGAPIRSERLLIDPETRGVRNALVYLVRPSAVREEARKAAPKTLRFRADRGMFVPHALAAMQGTEILVSTDDPAVYQVRSRLPGAEFLIEENDTLLDRPRVRSHEGINALFGNFEFFGNFREEGRRISLSVRPRPVKPRPIPIVEDLHPWMSAWWLILDHPYFAVTDERGAFEIHDVPTGPQQVIVWQESVDPSGKVFEGEVVIQGGGATAKDFTIEPAQVQAERGVKPRS